MIPEFLNENFLRISLQMAFYNNDIIIKHFTIKKMNLNGGDNYCSEIYQAHIIYSDNSDVNDRPIPMEDQEIHLIIKTIHQQKQPALERLKIFNREQYFYMELKNRMETLMRCNTENSEWSLSPRLIYSSASSLLSNQSLVFEDLAWMGFNLASRQLGLNYAECKAVLKHLAEYHACSMVLLHTDPDLARNIQRRFSYGILNKHSIESPSFKLLFGRQLLKLSEILRAEKDYESISKKLSNYYKDFTNTVCKAVYPLNGPINVINHGDLWVNNILLKGSSDARLELRFIDFQLSFYGSPGFDVQYFLNTSVQMEILQWHREELLQHYATTLTETLTKLPYRGVMPSIDLIMEEISKREAYGFFVAYGFFPIMSMAASDSENNTLDNLNQQEFITKKIDAIFKSNPRTLQTLKFIVKRLDQLQLF